MSELREEIRAAVTAIIERAELSTCVPITKTDDALWDVLVDSGFTGLGVGESLGGSGGSIADALDVVSVVAGSGAAVPIVEQCVAGWLAASAGLSLPDGLTTVGEGGDLNVEDDGNFVVLNGALETIAWADRAANLVVRFDRGEGSYVGIIERTAPGISVVPGTDLIGAPLSTVSLVNVRVRSQAAPIDALGLATLGGLAYAVALTAAARTVCDAAIRYTSERVQFGRPLVKFQAVQQRLAQLASLTVSLERAVDTAVDQVEQGTASALTAVAAAKQVASNAAREVAAAGHQLHGAIGFTAECALGRSTTALWSWRDRWGNEDDWAEILAEQILEDGADVWDLIVGNINVKERV